jgi:hypothetical protein
MRIFCKLGRHEAGTRIAYNAGTYFATCTHCTGALILSSKGWRAVPRGYRVVWKGRRTQDLASSENQLELCLFPPGEPAKVPAKRAAPRALARKKIRKSRGRRFGARPAQARAATA